MNPKICFWVLKLRTVPMTSPLEERTVTVVPLGLEQYIFILETEGIS